MNRHTPLRLSSIYLFLVTCFFAACSKDEDAGNVERNETDLSYGTHPHQRMDVLFPQGYNSSTPVVFLIHGGGFVAGLKEDFATEAELFRDEGFITVNISHRLVDTTGLLQSPPTHQASAIKISDELADVHAAVNLYRSKAADWKTGTGRMYMAGHSAGAILTMLYLFGDQNADNQIRAGANWAGVTDLSIPHDSLLDDLDPRWIEAMYRAVGVMPSTANNLAFMAVSPFWVANLKGGMPLISIYPSENSILNMPDEETYGLAQTQKLHELLQNKGIRQKLSVYTGSDHGFSKPPGTWGKVIKETAVFFREN